MKDVVAGTVANYMIFSIPMPSQNGLDEVLKILAAGLVSYAMTALHARVKERRTKKPSTK